MSSELTKFNPNSFDELVTFCGMLSRTQLVPRSLHGKTEDIMAIVMMGADLRLSPMQSLQNISCINGKVTIWGDGLLAICQGHPGFVGMKEWIEKEGTPDAVAYCRVHRRFGDEVQETVRSFSVDNAKRASLWGNRGPWSQYPERMLQMRARAFACRDAFADALRGIMPREEVMDYNDRPAGKVPARHPALDAVVPSASSASAVNAEYVMCDAEALEEIEDFIDPHAAAGSLDVAMNTDLVEPPPGVKPQQRGLVSVLQVPGVMTPEKPRKSKKPTNKERCLDAIKLYKKDFEVEQEDLLEAAGIKTIDKVSNKQITWLIDTYKKLKTKAITPAEVFGKNKTPDLPPVPPVPSSSIEDAQL